MKEPSRKLPDSPQKGFYCNICAHTSKQKRKILTMVFMVEALQICRWACYLIKERKNEAKMSKKSLLFSSLLPSDELCFIDA